ncbi:MAG: response regulator [Lachnospiraceae bacterium]
MQSRGSGAFFESEVIGLYKAILVDDEVIIREAMKESVKWEETGFELADTCEHGKEAIEKIKIDPPDLVITDICMPFVDGIQLAEYIHENHPETKVVILSGYDEFEYAKSAIKYEVLEYILKPVTAFELTEILNKIKEKLDQEYSTQKRLHSITENYKKSKPILKERFLNHLIHSKDHRENVMDKLVYFGLDIQGTLFTVIQVESTNMQKDELILFALYNVTAEIMEDYKRCVVFQTMDEITTIIFAGDSEYQIHEDVYELLSKVQSIISSFLHINTMVTVGRNVEYLEELPLSFENLVFSKEYKFLYPDNAIIYGIDYFNKENKGTIDTSKWIEEVLIVIRHNNQQQLDCVLQNFFDMLRTNYISKNMIVASVQNIVLKIIMLVDELGLESEELLEEEQQFLTGLYGYTKIEEMTKEMKQFCKHVSTTISGERDSEGKKIAIRAQEYIEENYKSSDISLNSVCDYLSISTSYFSMIFKNYTGETFIEALTKKRMEKAKLLLINTALKTYEIADEVGYSDPHYFSSIFKKATGETPTVYAKRKRMV